MSKGMQKQLGILLLDVIVVSGLFYGSFAEWLSLTYLWVGMTAIVWGLVIGKVNEIYEDGRMIGEMTLLCLGSALVLFSLYVTGNFITLIALSIADLILLGVIITANKNLKELNHE